MASPVRREHLTVELIAERDAAAAGSTLRVGLRLQHDPNWHTYWRNPGDSGLPTKIHWTLPPGITAGPIEWPAPHRLPAGPLTNFGYDGDVLLPVTLTIDAAAMPGTMLIQAKASWLVCEDLCIPGSAELETTIEIGTAAAMPDQRTAPWFAAATQQQPAAAPDWRATIVDLGTDLAVTLTAPGAALDPNAVEIFPETLQVFANGRGRAERAGDGQVRITTAKSDYFVALPQRIPMVVVVGEGPSRRAHALEATVAPADQRR